MAETVEKTREVRPRSRKAKGQSRPQYLVGADLDRVMIMLMGLVSEVSALRDRVDTHEALAEQSHMPTTAAVESYSLDTQRRSVREANRDAMLTRLLRVITEERDSADGQG